MSDFPINYRYIKGYPLEYLKTHNKLIPAAFAIQWCMNASYFYRIFTKDDLKAFLFRLPIALHSFGIVESWLLNNYLFKYKFNGVPYVLTLDDIIMHFGIEIIDNYINYEDRAYYLKNVGRGIEFALLHGDFDKIEIVLSENKQGVLQVISGEQSNPEINEDLIAKAYFFTRDCMKFVPENTFINRAKELISKEKELEEQRESFEYLPTCDIVKIPANIIKRCLEIMYNPEYAKKLLVEHEEFSKIAEPMIYLAWLYANDFTASDGAMIFAKEKLPFDYGDDKPERFSVFPIGTIESHNIEKTVPLLKGLLKEEFIFTDFPFEDIA